ncbi:MAG: helix-turn-helix domain-containing protein [Rhizomicrobium sp.]
MSITRTQKQLGAALRRYRKQQALTQADLGRLVGSRQATISGMEVEGAGTLETLFSMLAALNLELVVQPRTKADKTQIAEIF